MAEIVKNYDNGSSIKVVYDYTQKIGTNQSTISMTLYVKRDAYGPSWNSKCNSYIQLDGTKVMTYTGSFNIGTSWVKIGSTVNKTVTHSSNGTKSVTIKGYFDSLGLTTKLEDLTVSGSVTLKTIPRASSISSISGSTIGSDVTINISRASSSFTHKVYYSFGDTKNYLLDDNVGTSLTFKPSMNDCEYVPNSTKGTATIKVDTYNGSTKIGSASKTFTLNVPSSVVPTFTDLTFSRIDGTVPSDWNLYIKTKSKVKVSITGAKGAYGSTIKSYSITGAGYSGTSSSLTTGYLNSSGTITFTAKITDSRGRTATKQKSITVTDYSPPVISNAVGIRCDVDGTPKEDGGYVSLTVSFTGDSISGKNTTTAEYRYKPENGEWSDYTPIENDTPVIFELSGESTSILEIKISDLLGSFTKDIIINSVKFIMDFKAGGNGIAFGKAAELEQALETAWPLILQQTGDEQIILRKKNGAIDNVIKFEDPYSENQDSWYINHYKDPSSGLHSLRFQSNYGNEDGGFTSKVIMYPGGLTQIVGSLKINKYVEFPVFSEALPNDWETTIYRPYDGTISIGVRNGGNEPQFLQWLGESGQQRFVLRTDTNGKGYLGTGSYRWNTGYFTNTITQSDLKDKENIKEIQNAKEFIMSLDPISYTLKDGDSGRVHMGFGAQTVAEIAKKLNMGNLSLYQASQITEDGEEKYYEEGVSDEQLSWGLNYHEFIAPLVKVIQEQELRIQELEKSIKQ